MSRDYMRLARTVCQRDAGFEPNFLTLGNSLESLLSVQQLHDSRRHHGTGDQPRVSPWTPIVSVCHDK